MPHTVTTTISSRSTPDGSLIEDSISQSSSVSYASKESALPTVPAAKSGSLTTRTDNDTGVVAFATGHGFLTGDLIDLFWSGGQRRAMTATVAGDNVTLDGGSGDDLPAAATAVTGMVPHEVAFTVDGDEVGQIVLHSPKPGYIVFVENPGVEADIAAATYSFTAAGGKVPFSPAGGTNPLATKTTTKVKFSHGNTADQVMKAIAYTGAE